MKAPGQEKVCVILNGHVAKMDIFDQSIYYICTYQVPNSEKVKTAVWRADLDGQNEEQVFETMSSLKTEHFQVSGSWYSSVPLIYRSVRHLRKLLTGKKFP